MLVPHAVITKAIEGRHYDLFQLVMRVLEDVDPEATCHDVCAEAARRSARLTHCRGYFVRKGVEHSWLEVLGEEVLIDAYPVGGASGPSMVCTEGILNPWNGLYVAQCRNGRPVEMPRRVRAEKA